MRMSRNCGGEYPGSRYRFQFANREIIRECPEGYFPDEIAGLYQSYSRLKMCKQLNISTPAASVTLLELDAYTTIEVESSKALDARMEKTRSKEGKKHGRK